ncbi:MAG: hypothetical protein COZ93_02640 [Nitrospirae bacterium CG_4_8_14_3_um_filter_44_28]|nr:MAG: hypothetical protein COZ93_02640 [Nitrospirae bacterium CG_4_8_14_3_um_filter_44_28]
MQIKYSKHIETRLALRKIKILSRLNFNRPFQTFPLAQKKLLKQEGYLSGLSISQQLLLSK